MRLVVIEGGRNQFYLEDSRRGSPAGSSLDRRQKGFVTIRHDLLLFFGGVRKSSENELIFQKQKKIR